MTELAEFCSEKLLQLTDAANICQILTMADRHQNEYLKGKLKRTLAGYLSDVEHSEAFQLFCEEAKDFAESVIQLAKGCR